MRNTPKLDLNLSPRRRALLDRLIENEGVCSSASERITAREDRTCAPLSLAQQRLWIINELEPDSAAYNEHFRLRLAGRVNVEILQQAINEIIRRHETLRTTFKDACAGPVQLIAPALRLVIPVIDLTAISTDVLDEIVDELAAAEVGKPFDLERGALLRMTLLRPGIEEHLLLFTIHHIISDGWSLGILIKELTSLYNTFMEGGPSPLPELEIQYADFAAWQRQQLRDELLQEQMAYWKRKLADAPVAELLTDWPRRASSSYRSARERFSLSSALTQKLKRLGEREGVTLFMTLLAGVQSILARYTGQQDIVIGSAIAGRNREETEDLIGFFVNTLVMRTDLSGNPSIGELLGRVRQTTLEAFAHQDVPFEKLVEEIQPRRGKGRHPLFQVMFSLQNMPLQRLNLSGLELKELAVGAGVTKFDLTILAAEEAESMTFTFEYARELFSPKTIDRLGSNLCRLLEKMVAEDVCCRVMNLALLADEEWNQVVVEWNQTASDHAAGKCLHELFQQQAECAPDAVAISFEQHQLSYAALNRRANQLARYLQRHGVGPEARVALFVERGIEMVVGLLGVVKAGGAYIPLDAAYPTERLRYMLEDSRAEVLLTQYSFEQRLPHSAAKVVYLDRDWDQIRQESQENPTNSVTPFNLTYVMYTSGSTGKPKGVAVEQRNVVKLVKGADYAEFGAQEVFLQFAPISFDASTFEIWGCLLNGGRLIIFPSEFQSLEQLGRVITEEQVTTLWLTAGLFNQMVDERLYDLRQCRQILAGGDALSVSHTMKVLERLPESRLINGYGPTEGTTFSCSHRVEQADGRGNSIPIGRPIANTQAYILDERLEPVPIGMAGELYIGGEGLARGYLACPDLTAASFVASPFSAGGDRLYRTGDRARFKEDGDIEFLGRVDYQVKLRGFRIEMGEVEAILMKHPGVREAIAVVKQTAEGDRRLVAYVIEEEAYKLGETELIAHMRETVPNYMLPSAVIVLDEFPLTANGKVDRGALPDPESRPGSAENQLPRSAIEEIVAGTWAEVMEKDSVGMAENFFDAGGHSLLATRIVSRLEQVFSIEIGLRTILESQTVVDQAAEIERKLGRGEFTQLDGIKRTPGREAPLSFSQQRLWFLDQLSPGSPAYNVYAAFRLKGQLNVTALQDSLNLMTTRHDALRTAFFEREGQPVQVISPAGILTIEHEDLSEINVARRDDLVTQLAASESARPFDLARAPLIRVVLFKLDEADYALLMIVHHIISDEWSIGLLVKELSTLYRGACRGEPVQLDELPIQYADFARWQRDWLRGEVLEKQLSYWKSRLAGESSALALPTERRRRAVESDRASSSSIVIDQAISQKMEALGRREGSTLFMSLLAAASCLLHIYSGEDDMILGTPIAGRNRSELQGLVGFFDNTLALRIQVRRDDTMRQLLGHVRSISLDAYANQDLPFDRLIEEIHPERSLAHNPLFRVMFVMKNPPPGGLALDGLTIQAIDIQAHTAKFDLMIFVERAREGIRVTAEYKQDLFDDATIARMLRHYERVVETFIEDFDRRVCDIDILLEAERRQLICDLDDSAFEKGEEVSIAELIEAQAARTPDAIALEFRDHQITYSMLNRRASKLANYLRSMGVGLESLVGVYMSRSVEMITGIIAVLKTGAAYVPLDPTYPAHRLKAMIEDAKPSVILTLRAQAGELEPYDTRPVIVDGAWDLIEQCSERLAAARPSADNIAYVIYTSGSTGKPKGVVMTHGCLINLLRWQMDRWQTAARARTLQYTSMSFDVSFQEIVSTLWAGGTLVLVDDEVRSDPDALWRAMKRSEVERLFAPYVALKQLALAAHERPDMVAASLREIITAGEALQIDAAIEGMTGLVGCSVDNQYGPSESHVVTAKMLSGDSREWARQPTIGKPVSNSRIYVLREWAQPLPTLASGELYIGGKSLGRGYLNKPELTAARFLPDPYSASGARVYRTGDEARYRPDGEVEFIGRLDNQVKIRGYRVELGEIESALRQETGVKDAVVVARDNESGLKRLVAYVVRYDRGDTSEKTLKRSLKVKLPEYMVPGQIVILSELPKTPSGKLDRRKLLDMTADYEPSDDPVVGEMQVAVILKAIWREVLGMEVVRPEDNFFDLGGHSLLATQLASRIRQLFNIDLSLRAIFEEQTFASLAKRIESEMMTTAGLQAAPVKRVPRDRNLPLSAQQRRLWFLEQLSPGSTAYNMRIGLKLTGELQVAALERSLNEVVRRHEVLRTMFAVEDGEPVQIIRSAAQVSLGIIDLSELGDAGKRKEIERLNKQEARRSLDLSRGHLIRCKLVRVGRQENLLDFSIHHIVSDGWSIGVLNREIGSLYEAYSGGDPSPLEELHLQYADYASWQNESLRGENLATLLKYWRNQLRGLPKLDLPTDRLRPEVQTFRGSSLSASLTQGLCASLHALSRSEGVTLFMLLLAAFKTVLSAYTGQQDIVVGTDIAHRNSGQVEAMIGLFTNQLVLRSDLSGDPTFGGLLRRVREVTLAAYAHQDLPFDMLVEDLQPRRSLGENPLFQVMFILQNAPTRSLALRGLTVERLPASEQSSAFDLSLSCEETESGHIVMLARYNTDLFEEATISNLLHHVEVILQEVVTNPCWRLSGLRAKIKRDRRRMESDGRKPRRVRAVNS
jgi:amino acid adenylation domain-containing protein